MLGLMVCLASDGVSDVVSYGRLCFQKTREAGLFWKAASRNVLSGGYLGSVKAGASQ